MSRHGDASAASGGSNDLPATRKPLRVWLVAVGEPLPTDPGHLRLLRVGTLAAMLQAGGHEVVWWTSAFDHQTKRMRTPPDPREATTPGYALRLLRGRGYARNVSLARIRDQRITATDFSRRIEGERPPDVILASYPTIDLCAACVAYGHAHRVPVVIDVRDLWPDIFLNLVPRGSRWLARLALAPMFRASRQALAGASALFGITGPFVDWACARAGRQRRALDDSFPLAYELGNVSAQALEQAREDWTTRGVHPGDRTLCFFGTLGRQFDIPTVLRAAALLRSDGYRIVICGAGDRLEQYRQHAAQLDNVILPGWVDAAAIQALMERSLAGLAPYHNEYSFTLSVPNKAIEYLAGGLPVLTCLDGELHRLIDDRACGLYWPEGDAERLAAVARALVADPAGRRRMSDNAKSTFEQYFSAKAVYGRLIERLSDVARAFRRQPE